MSDDIEMVNAILATSVEVMEGLMTNEDGATNGVIIRLEHGEDEVDAFFLPVGPGIEMLGHEVVRLNRKLNGDS